MAVNPQQDQAAASFVPSSRPHDHLPSKDYDVVDGLDDELGVPFSPSFCLCFPAHCFSRRRTTKSGSRTYFLQTDQEDCSEEDQDGLRWYSGGRRWVVEKLKKAREISELVAGPKWKNFIRRFSRPAFGSSNSKKRTKFQYDPQSYALNFDDGDATDDCGYPDFSARFAAPRQS